MTPRKFMPGQKVFLLHSETAKLFVQCQGPFEVLRKVGLVNYEVSETDRRQPT